MSVRLVVDMNLSVDWVAELAVHGWSAGLGTSGANGTRNPLQELALDRLAHALKQTGRRKLV